MPRLTNAIRDAIATALIKHSFGDRADVLSDENARIANAIYDRRFDRATRKRMDELPEGWLPKTDGVTVQLDNTVMHFYFNGREYNYERVYTHVLKKKLGDAVYKRLPTNAVHGYFGAFNSGEREAIVERLETHRRNRETFNNDVSAARTKALATLSSFHTVEKLVGAWPEVEPFIPKDQAPAKQLPALPLNELNRTFGL